MDNQVGVHAYRWEARTFKGTHQIQKGRASYQGTEAAVRPMEDSGEVGVGVATISTILKRGAFFHTHTLARAHAYTRARATNTKNPTQLTVKTHFHRLKLYRVTLVYLFTEP